jgi:anti-anti-sigma factor
VARVEIEQVDDSPTVLRLVGDMDGATMAKAMPDLLKLSASPPANLAIDASEVKFLDSAAIGALVMVALAVQDRGGLVTMDASAQARRPLVLCGIGRLLGLSTTAIG